VLVLLVGVAFFLALARPVALRNHAHRARVSVAAVAPRHGQASTSSTPSDTTPSQTAAIDAGRMFLAGYLAYLYGRAPATHIQDASPTLIGFLQANPPRVSPAMREHVARIVGLRSTPAAAGQLGVQAVINDGGIVDYPIGLLLEDRGGRLLVSGLDGEG
jgi:hypothetical protein